MARLRKVVAPNIRSSYFAKKFCKRDVLDVRVCNIMQTVWDIIRLCYERMNIEPHTCKRETVIKFDSVRR